MKLDRSLLPAPSTTLRRLGIDVPVKTNAAGYWSLRCPFHKAGEEQNPSLNLHSLTGHYRCHACGEKGGDVLDFYMAMTGKNFCDAVSELGAWSKS